jgi:pimeloyl-ACP methyl ester carboxylesterase
VTRAIFTALIFLLTGGPGFSQLSMDNPVSITPIPRTVPDPGCHVPCERVAVIFVHGITGSSTTWKNGEIEWPKLLADDRELQAEIGVDLDVYRVDYYSYLNEGPSVPRISKALSQELDSQLFGEPFQGKGYTKIVMICHSLGGILCREHLLHVKLRWGHAFLSLFRATITLGTPLRGSTLANLWIVRASGNEQVRVLRPDDVNDFLQLLANSTEEFTQKRFTLNCPEISFYAGFEQNDTPLIEGTPIPTTRVVSEESATQGIPLLRTRGFAKDHRQLVRPANRSDEVYRWVADILRECRLGGACSAPIGLDCGRPAWLHMQ